MPKTRPGILTGIVILKSDRTSSRLLVVVVGQVACVPCMIEYADQVKQFERGVFGGEEFLSVPPAQHPLEKRSTQVEV